MIHVHKATVTASAGSASSTTLKGFMGIIRQVIVIPNTDTTVYQVDIKDEDSDRIYYNESVSGALRDQIAIPARGEHTINILNASPNDDTFKIKVGIEE